MKASWQRLPITISSNSSGPSHTPNIDSPKHNQIPASDHPQPPSSSSFPPFLLLTRAPMVAASLLLCCLLSKLLFCLQALPQASSPIPTTICYHSHPHSAAPLSPSLMVKAPLCPLGGAFHSLFPTSSSLGWSPDLLLAHSILVPLSQLPLSSSRPALITAPIPSPPT